MKKKVLFIITILCLCVAPTRAVSPYGAKGVSGIGNYSTAQMPTATMQSTSMYRARTMSSASMQGSVYTPAYGSVRTMVNTIYRPGANMIASNVMGVTAADTYENMGGEVRKVNGRRNVNEIPLPGDACGDCKWVWDEELKDWVCSQCGATLDMGCDCDIESGYCWCPLDFDASAMIFMTMLCVAYVAWKNRGEKEEQEEFI